MNSYTELVDGVFQKRNRAIEDYRISSDLLSDKTYMTKHFFSARRDISGDELCLYILANISQLSAGSGYIGGFVTLLCYRIFEDTAKLDWIDSILALKEVYDKECLINTPDNARWFFSSSNTISTALLLLDREQEAKKILEYSLTKFSSTAHTPLLYMNKSFILYQLALIYAEDGEYDNAINLFERCFLDSKNGIDEIFHPRNNFFLRMYSDCETLLKLAKFSGIAMNKLLDNSASRSGTRFMSFAGSEAGVIDTKLPSKRFHREFIPDNNWFSRCQVKLNKKL